MSRTQGLKVLSLDGGDARCMSQLYLLQEFMHRLEFRSQKTVLPCDFFDLITGVDSSSPIAAFLGLFRMSVEDAQAAFHSIYTQVFAEEALSPEARTQRLENELLALLDSQNVPRTAKLLDFTPAKSCKVALCYSPAERLDVCSVFRNYKSPHQVTPNVTVFDALRAAWATPGLVSPVSIGPKGRDGLSVSAVNGFANPIQETIKEAYHVYGKEAKISCLLSLGCGFRGVVSLRDRTGAERNISSIATTDCDAVAEEVYRRFARLGIYYRLSVDHGLEGFNRFGVEFGSIKSHVDAYLAKKENNNKLDRCISASSTTRTVTMEQLYGSQAQGLRSAHGLPPLSAYFVLRKKPMEAIVRGLIEGDGSTQRIMVVSGLGGSGKTQLSLKFARDFRDSYRHILFVDASTTENVRKGLVSRVHSMSTDHSPTTVEEAIDLLSNPDEQVTKDWLIIFDNADNPEVPLINYIPACDHGSILISTRDPSLGELAPESHLELGNMDEEEAVEVLISAAFPSGNHSSHAAGSQAAETTSPLTDRDRDAAVAIARDLGYLPIAVVQAGCFIKQHKGLHQYLERLRTNRSDLLKRPTRIHRDQLKYPHGVYASFDICLQALSSRAVQLLGVLSFFHFANFPVSLFSIAAKSQFRSEFLNLVDRPPEFNDSTQFLMDMLCPNGEWKEDEVDGLLEELQRYSLVTLVPIHTTVTLRFHPLVHSWARDRLTDEEQETHRTAAVRLLGCGVTDEDDFGILEYLLPHIASLSKNFDSLHLNDQASFGRLVLEEDDTERYLRIWRQVYQEVERIHGKNDRRTSRAGLQLADAYWRRDDLATMEAMEREVVGINTLILGLDHSETIHARANLARSMRLTNRHSIAAEMEAEILRVRIRDLGLAHRDTAQAMVDLAQTFNGMKRHKDEEWLLVGAAAIQTKLLGRSAAVTISSLDLLAQCHHDQGQHAEAESVQKDVLQLRQLIHGEQHLSTVNSMAWLASRYHEQGRHEEAEALRKVEVEIRTKMQGPRDPSTLIAMHWLARSWYQQKRYDDADRLWREELEGQEHQGPLHMGVLNATYWIARTAFEAGRYDDAIHWWQKEAQDRQEFHGAIHADTLNSLHWLARANLSSKRYEEAEKIWRQELEGRLELHGRQHKDTMLALDWLGRPLLELKRFEEAEVLWDEVREYRREAMGTRSEDYLNVTDWLSRAKFERKEYGTAEGLWKEVWEGRLAVHGNRRHRDVLIALDWQASAVFELKRYEEAKTMWEEVLDGYREVYGENDDEVYTAKGWLATACVELKQYDKAFKLRKEQLEGCRKTHGDKNEKTLKGLSGLAMVYIKQDRYEAVEPLIRELVEGYKEVYGARSAVTMTGVHWLGRSLWEQKRYAEAEEIWREEVDGNREVHGALHENTLLAIEWLAKSIFEQGRHTEAEPLFKEALRGNKEIHDDNHEDVLVTMDWCARTSYELKRYEDAKTTWEEVVKKRRAIQGVEGMEALKDFETIRIVGWLGTAYNCLGRYADAVRVWEEELTARRLYYTNDRLDMYTTAANLASAYFGLSNFEKAEALFKEELDGRRELQGDTHTDTLESMNGLATTYYTAEKYEQAAVLFKEEAAVRRKQFDQSGLARALEFLARVYRAQRKYADAADAVREAVDIRRLILSPYDPVLLDTVWLSSSIWVDYASFSNPDPPPYDFTISPQLQAQTSTLASTLGGAVTSEPSTITHDAMTQNDTESMEAMSAPDPGGDPTFVPPLESVKLKSPRRPFSLRPMFRNYPNSWSMF